MTAPALLTAGQVATRLGISARRVRRLAETRALGQRFGRAWLFTEADVAAMGGRKPGRPKTATG
jgi:hypothetical protein